MAAKIPESCKQDHCFLCGCEFLKTPKLLACFHSFCKECLQEKMQGLSSGDSMACPRCSMVMIVPVGGIGGLPDDFLEKTKLQLAKIHNNKIKFCNVCKYIGEEILAFYYCINCQYHLCERDKKRHKATPSQRDHCVISYEDMTSGKYDMDIISSKISICKKHSNTSVKQLSFYCKVCEDLACEDCLLTTHEDHSFTSTGKISEVQQNKIKQLLYKIMTVEEEKHKSTRNLRKDLSDVRENAKQVVCEIREWGQYMKSIVKKTAEGSVQHVESLYSTEKSAKEQILQRMTNQKQAYDNITNFMKVVKEYTSDNFVLEHFKTTANNMEMCLNALQISPSPRPKRYGFEFKNEIDTEKNLQQLIGVIKEKNTIFQKEKSSAEEFLISSRYNLSGEKTLCATSGEFIFHSTFGTSGATAVSTLSNGDIIVLSLKSIHIFDISGNVKKSIAMDAKEYIWSVVSYEGHIFVPFKNIKRGIITFDYDLVKKEVITMPSEIEFSGSLALAIDANRNIAYVCCAGKNTVYKCSLSNSEAEAFITDGLSYPNYICTTNKGYCVISNRDNCTVTTFDNRGHLKWTYGSKGRRENEFDVPRGVCVDKQDNVFVADFRNHRIHILNMDGHFCRFVEIFSRVRFPCALHYSNRKLFVLCQEPNQLHVFVHKNEFTVNE